MTVEWDAAPGRVNMTRDAKLITAKALDAQNRETEKRMTTPHPLTPHVAAVIDPSFYVERYAQALVEMLLDDDGRAEHALRFQELIARDLETMEGQVRETAQSIPAPPMPNREGRRHAGNGAGVPR